MHESENESEAAQSCPTLSDPMDCSLPGFSIHGIFQARELEWGAIVLSVWPDGLQQIRLPCPSPAPRAYSCSCPSSRWCHPTVSSSVIPFSSHLQYLPTSGSFLMSQFPTSDDLIIGVSASPSILPMNIQDWFPFRIDWLGLPAVQGTLKSLLQHHNWKASILQCSASFIIQLSHPYMTTGKTIALTRRIFVGKVMSLLFFFFLIFIFTLFFFTILY